LQSFHGAGAQTAAWLQERLRESGLAWFSFEGHPVVTAPTARLQEFVRRHALRAEARGEPLELVPFDRP